MKEPVEGIEPVSAAPIGTPGTFEPVTLSVQGLDIRDVFAMFSSTRDVNIVSSGDVGGRLSIELHEVPFEQALRARFQRLTALIGECAEHDIRSHGFPFPVRE